MARKTNVESVHDFTQQIHSTKRSKDHFEAPRNNWNEKQAKEENKLSCKDCKFFLCLFGCYRYIGKWHKPCNEFEWD